MTTTTTTTTRPGASARWAGGSRAPSPAGSLHSVNTTAGSKRKEREFDHDDDGGGEATNINVVVRCRGRNEREVRENSAVVVSTQGVKGKLVELSMGPSALSNKTYNFDGVFSQAADQSMIFDNVVKPILDDVRVLLGSLFSCPDVCLMSRCSPVSTVPSLPTDRRERARRIP